MAKRVSVNHDSDEVWILVDGYPHLHFWKKNYRGFQSYYELKYTIEIYLKDQNIRLEYDDKEIWKEVLLHLYEAF